MKVSILIASYRRPEYLQWNLSTLLRQQIDKNVCEVLVLNDGVEDTTIEVVKYYAGEGMPIRYLFTGQRNREGLQWRVPGFCWNVGLQWCDGDIVIFTCAEMYHLGQTFWPIVRPVLEDDRALGTPRLVHDDDGSLVRYLNGPYLANFTAPETLQILTAKIEECRCIEPDPFRSNPYMPFWMAISRKRLLDIGGFDEDFTGIASDDNDLMERLLSTGCHYEIADCEVIHLHHGRRPPEEVLADDRFRHNRRMMVDRRGQNVRNQGRPWGVLQENLGNQAALIEHEHEAQAVSAWAAVLYELLPKSYSLLDVGCGDKVLSSCIKARVNVGVTTVDSWPGTRPDILCDLEVNPLPCKPSSYDVVLLMDVVEHLSHDRGQALIEQCKIIARQHVFIYTPKTFFSNDRAGEGGAVQHGNPHLLHKCLWTREELEASGFRMVEKFDDRWFGIWSRGET